MSLPRLVRSSPDLTRLVNEGYAVRIRSGHLVIEDVPFVTAAGGIVRGSLVCPLDMQGERTGRPSTHVMWFSHIPHSKDGAELTDLIHDRTPQALAPGVEVACSSSQKAHGRDYDNYYDKVIAYAALVVGEAQAIDPTVVATTYKPVESDDADGVFKYLDTNSSRAQISALNERLALNKIAIVGLGGTGSYLLDQLAKVPIRQVHLYDGDQLSTHNAFRSPGAASVDELNAAPFKVDYYAARYGPLRWGVHPHPVYVTAENVDELADVDFVFIAMDASPDKKILIDTLTVAGVPFIDTGIGVRQDPGGLAGLLRVTTSLPGRRDHIDDDELISYELGDGNEYETNIQVAELNALAAVLAVIRFKKQYGFYADTEAELHSHYRIDVNEIVNEYSTAPDKEEPEDGGSD